MRELWARQNTPPSKTCPAPFPSAGQSQHKPRPLSLNLRPHAWILLVVAGLWAGLVLEGSVNSVCRGLMCWGLPVCWFVSWAWFMKVYVNTMVLKEGLAREIVLDYSYSYYCYYCYYETIFIASYSSLSSNSWSLAYLLFSCLLLLLMKIDTIYIFFLFFSLFLFIFFFYVKPVASVGFFYLWFCCISLLTCFAFIYYLW